MIKCGIKFCDYNFLLFLSLSASEQFLLISVVLSVYVFLCAIILRFEELKICIWCQHHRWPWIWNCQGEAGIWKKDLICIEMNLWHISVHLGTDNLSINNINVIRLVKCCIQILNHDYGHVSINVYRTLHCYNFI